MVARILLKIGNALIVLIAVAVLNFGLVRLAPGDPALVLAGQSGAADEAFVARLRSDFGLDRPLPVQLLEYLRKMATFDLGQSYRQNKPVSTLIADRISNTVLLTMTSFLLALILGIVLGSIAAWHRGEALDLTISTIALLFYAMPVFFTGLILLYVFSMQLGWLPGFGSATVDDSLTWPAMVVDRIRHLILPALTLSLLYIATYIRLTRASAIEVANMDYVKTARAKGLPDRRIRQSHVLRNAILPVLTIAGMQAGQMVSGAVVVETIFGWPGIGRLAYEALLQRDYPVLLGVFFICSIMVVVFNALTDITYRAFDPRVGS